MPALTSSTIGEFATHNEENELFCVPCSKEFSTNTNKNQRVCKGRRLANDIVSVKLCCACKLIECELADFIDMSLEGVVENNEESDK